MAHVTRIDDTISGNQPLRYVTGAEQAKTVTIDNDTITADAYGRKLVVKGELLTKITATGLYGPYYKNSYDGREDITRGSAVISAEDADVQLGDKAIGGWFAHCTFDPSELTLHDAQLHTGTDIKDAFPTCEWED